MRWLRLLVALGLVLALSACSSSFPDPDPVQRVELLSEASTAQAGELVIARLEIEDPVNDIIYGNHSVLERYLDPGCEPAYFLYALPGFEEPTYSVWRKNAMHTMEGYSGEGEVLIELPPDLEPGRYRVVFEYVDLGERTDSDYRSGRAEWGFRVVR